MATADVVAGQENAAAMWKEMRHVRDARRRSRRWPTTRPPCRRTASVVFIGRIRSPWTDARGLPEEHGAPRAPPACRRTRRDRRALPRRPAGLAGTSHVILLTWLHHAPRNLIVQKPRHATEAERRFRAALARRGRTRSACMWSRLIAHRHGAGAARPRRHRRARRHARHRHQALFRLDRRLPRRRSAATVGRRP